MESGKVVLGVLAGLAAGAVLGILFAPDKGTETRKKITRKGEEYAGALEEKYEELLDAVSHKYGDTKEGIEGFIAKGKAKLNELTKEHEKTPV